MKITIRRSFISLFQHIPHLPSSGVDAKERKVGIVAVLDHIVVARAHFLDLFACACRTVGVGREKFDDCTRDILRREDHDNNFPRIVVAGRLGEMKDPGLGMSYPLLGRRCRSILFLGRHVDRNLAEEAVQRYVGNMVAGEACRIENYLAEHMRLASLASGLGLPKRGPGIMVCWGPTGFEQSPDHGLELERQSLVRHEVEVAYVRRVQVARLGMESLIVASGFHKEIVEGREAEPSVLGTVGMEIQCCQERQQEGPESVAVSQP